MCSFQILKPSSRAARFVKNAATAPDIHRGTRKLHKSGVPEWNSREDKRERVIIR